MSTETQTETMWHQLQAEEALQRLEVEAGPGLSAAEVQARRTKYGTNELVESGLKHPLRILWEQFTEAMVVVLLAAAIVSALISDLKDAVAILAIVILNGVLGFVQEYRAERAIAALRQMTAPHVKVRREGHVREIESPELVPGDIILLEAGDAVPADARLLEAANLRLQEASLTGESMPVDKKTPVLEAADVPLGDRHNMLFLGTAVTYGRGTAVVVETGMRTQLGRIAQLIQTVVSEQTPLQKRMGGLGRSLALVSLVIVAVVFGLGILRGEDAGEMFLTAVALAVAAVPEGLPAVVTIALALGAQRMLRRNALIRKLPAVETLGSVTVICSDKTGTLTENRMTVKVLDVAKHTLDLDQTMRRGMPVFHSLEAIEKVGQPAQALMLAGGALCNDAFLEPDEITEGDYRTVGDPTEGALLVAAGSYGLWKPTLEEAFPRRDEVPFSSERKRMTTLHSVPDGTSQTDIDPVLQSLFREIGTPYVAFAKGAVDSLIEVSDRVWVEDKTHPLTDQWRERILESNDQMAGQGLRVLGIGFKRVEEAPAEGQSEELEQDLVFIGLVGMMDPPRPEVKEAVQIAQHAGIRPVMITGDHPLTARRIAEDLDIAGEGDLITGQELARLTTKDLQEIVENVSVYARVSPEHKLNIVEALQNKGHIVAMTGDGVNDAPALRRSDIGVAMGITGTDVSKEASDMVLLDDNFATIVKAIREGRTIYDNVRKFIRYTLTSNTGEIITMLFAPFLGMPIPLTALQILWINLVTDGLPGLALSLEPSEKNTMERPPHPPNESIFARGMGQDILWNGILMGLVALGVGYWGWSAGNPAWPTMVFTTLTLTQMGNALGFRSETDSLFRIGLFSNLSMLGAVLLTFVLQMAVTYIEPLQVLFGTQALSARDLAISLLASTVLFWAIEIEKFVQRRLGLRAHAAPVTG